MKRTLTWAALTGLAVLLGLSAGSLGRPGVPPSTGAGEGKKARPDSYLYYGPGHLAKTWSARTDAGARMRLGRDTWIHWTWGNQKFLRAAAVAAGNLPVPVSIDLFRVLDSRNRQTRFRDMGLINEPNCEQAREADEYGLWLDRWKGDPHGYYPGDARYLKEYGSTYPGTKEKLSLAHYGRPSGVVGLRLFDNPRFSKEKWDVQEYFRNPGKTEPPYLVGFSCAFCHIAFDPVKPPLDPENPRWENLAANMGNQYFREGEIFLGKGRVILGDAHPQPGHSRDPYKTLGLTEDDFLYHYAVTQPPGTSETSRLSYDFINNPNTINPIMHLGLRLPLGTKREPETGPWTGARPRPVLRILKDGADGIGLRGALIRVPINIGCEGDYWVDRLFNPATGKRQRPFRIGDVLAGMSDAEKKEVESALGPVFGDHGDRKEQRERRKRYREQRVSYKSPWSRGEGFGDDWREAWKRMPGLEAYLLSYGQPRLEDALKSLPPADQKRLAPDPKLVAAGKKVFLDNCIECHSSTLVDRDGKRLTGKEWAALAEKFPANDWLADDKRHSGARIGTNLQRAMATNAIDGDIWAEFSSREYKALPPLGRIKLRVPVVHPLAPVAESKKVPVEVEFEPPGGGRGYYRTPSLIGLWATAPYLHNNALGDYRVVKADGARAWVPNDGRRIGEKTTEGKWIDHRIDASVEGRLLMFQDAMEKMLKPAKRHGWVKRTSTPSTLLPFMENAIPQLVLTTTRAVVERELRAWLMAEGVPAGLRDEAAALAGNAFSRVATGVLDDARATLRLGAALAHVKLRDHARRLFDLAFDDLKDRLLEKIAPRLKGKKLPLDRLKAKARQGLLAKLDSLDKDLRAASLLAVPVGTPINLYANLNPQALAYAALATVRHKGDPLALARELLALSDCPDLVEDRGHTFGEKLTDEEKKALIEFLKTL